jgi:hypothetical protein
MLVSNALSQRWKLYEVKGGGLTDVALYYVQFEKDLGNNPTVRYISDYTNKIIVALFVHNLNRISKMETNIHTDRL